MNRRDFLKSLGVLAVTPTGCVLAPPSLRGTVVNDIHSQLNETNVARILQPKSLAAVRNAVRQSDILSIAAGRHAMGGQQFCSGAALLDTTKLNRVLSLDADKGTVEVEAGIQWPELVNYLIEMQQGRANPWSIIQKQTGADRLSIGGALAANVHGRGLRLRPFIDDVVSFTLVNAEGVLVTCSRSENAELFRLVIGGYGLFGVVYSVKLRLQPRHKVQRIVEIKSIADVIAAFDERMADGFQYGDFQFSIDPASDGFLRQGVFSCYKPVDGATPISETQKQLSDQNWRDLLYYAHVDKPRVYDLYAGYYLSTSGQVYWSDEHQLSIYPDGYHLEIDRKSGVASTGSEMITEIYVPRGQLADFMYEAADDFRRHAVDVIYGTVRLIEKDDESYMAWAKQNYACIIFNLHVKHTTDGIRTAAESFRRLIDMAIARGGNYYLTYHRWATREQVLACYPQFPEFLRLKKQYDPAGRFQSEWYRHYEKMFA